MKRVGLRARALAPKPAVCINERLFMVTRCVIYKVDTRNKTRPVIVLLLRSVFTLNLSTRHSMVHLRLQNIPNRMKSNAFLLLGLLIFLPVHFANAQDALELTEINDLLYVDESEVKKRHLAEAEPGITTKGKRAAFLYGLAVERGRM